ncbi:MAG: hypothetical protein ACKVS6_03530 [Planctomycetota bacterium]
MIITETCACLLLLIIQSGGAKAPAKPGAAGEKFEVGFVEKKIATIPGSGSIEGRAYFSPSGRKVAYVIKEGNKLVPVIDDKKGKSYHYVDPPVWAAAADHVAWRVGNRLADNEHERWWVFLDDKKIAEDDWIGSIGLSPDGKQAAYWLNPGARIDKEGVYQGGKWIFAFGNKKSSEFSQGFGLEAPVWSPDGKQVVTFTQKANNASLMINDKVIETKGAAFFMLDSFVFSRDGKRLAYTAHQGGAGGKMRCHVQVGEEKYGLKFDDAGSPIISPDGKKIAYRVLTGDKLQIAIDQTVASKQYDVLGAAVFSPDNKKLVFAANKGGTVHSSMAVTSYAVHNSKGGKWFMVAGDQEKEEFDMVDDPVFSNDGKSLAYRAKSNGKWHVIVNDKKSEAFDDVDAPVFSSDGKKVAFGARIDREFWWKVLDL